MKNAKEFFKSKSKMGYDSRLEGINGCYLFSVENSGNYLITVKNGKVSYSDKKAKADCEIYCNEKDFLLISEGKQNLLTAAMQGRVVVKGDLSLAQKLYALTRSKPNGEIKKGNNETG